jgi:hypothetical protein
MAFTMGEYIFSGTLLVALFKVQLKIIFGSVLIKVRLNIVSLAALC